MHGRACCPAEHEGISLRRSRFNDKQRAFVTMPKGHFVQSIKLRLEYILSVGKTKIVVSCMRMAAYQKALWNAQEALCHGEQQMLAACRHSLAHGPLLTLRYILPYLPWQDSSVQKELQAWLQSLLQKLTQAMQMTLPPLARPEDANMGNICPC